MDAEEPDLPLQSFNAVLCRFGLMFFPNLPTALSRLRQLLIPGGRFAAAVWGTAEHTPLGIAHQVIQQVCQLPPPPPGIPGAYSLGREELLSQHFLEAGFSEVQTGRAIVALEYTSPNHYLEERLATRLNTRLAFEAATEENQRMIRNTVTEVLQSYKEEDGMIRLRNNAICSVAW